MDKLTKKQKRILEYIEKFMSDNAYPPTFMDICNRFSLTIGTVQDHIYVLVKKGYLEKIKNKARGFRIIKNSEGIYLQKTKQDCDLIPLYGNVAAGEPIFADNNIQGYIMREKNQKGHKLHFALKVKGDSMIDSGIYDGDIVLVRKQESADDGDIVIALLEDEATVKRLKKTKIKAYLEASNVKYKAIINKPFSIIGKVIELRRKYTLL